MQETQVQSLGQEDPLGKGMATPLQCSCLGNFHGQRLQSMGSQRVGCDWTTNVFFRWGNLIPDGLKKFPKNTFSRFLAPVTPKPRVLSPSDLSLPQAPIPVMPMTCEKGLQVSSFPWPFFPAKFPVSGLLDLAGPPGILLWGWRCGWWWVQGARVNSLDALLDRLLG